MDVVVDEVEVVEPAVVVDVTGVGRVDEFDQGTEPVETGPEF